MDFQQILDTLKEGIAKLAADELKKFRDAAKADGLTILTELKDNLKNWTTELAEGEISKEDFEDLVLGQKDLIGLIALKNAGLAEISVDRFKASVFDFITNTIIGLIP